MTTWTHKVVKSMRGMGGEFFDFPTAGTFASEQEAREYAESFARDQGAAGVRGARIEVRSRKSRDLGDGIRTHHIATYRSDDYLKTSARAMECGV